MNIYKVDRKNHSSKIHEEFQKRDGTQSYGKKFEKK